MQSIKIGLPKNTCIYEIANIFSRLGHLKIKNLNNLEIIFVREYMGKWETSNYNYSYKLNIKGTIRLEENDETVINIGYKKFSFILWYLFSSPLLIFSFLVFYLIIEKVPYSIIFGIPMGIVLIIFFILLPFSAKKSYYKDEEALADRIYYYLSDVSNVYLSNVEIFTKNYYNIPESFVCPFCGHKNAIGSIECSNCLINLWTAPKKEEILGTTPKKIHAICLICRKPIQEKDGVYCPNCNAPYHRREFLEWLKVKAHCRICKKELDLWEFQKYLEHTKQIEDSISIKCPNCKELLPQDTNFCMFCGIKIENPTEYKTN